MGEAGAGKRNCRYRKSLLIMARKTAFLFPLSKWFQEMETQGEIVAVKRVFYVKRQHFLPKKNSFKIMATQHFKEVVKVFFKFYSVILM